MNQPLLSVFCGGSLTVKTIPSEAIKSLGRIMENGFTILVGDAHGADSLIQDHLYKNGYKNVVVYHMSRKLRNCFDNDWIKKPVANTGGRTVFTAKDVVMSNDCNYGLFIWDGVSKGTVENMHRLEHMNKKYRLFRI